MLKNIIMHVNLQHKKDEKDECERKYESRDTVGKTIQNLMKDIKPQIEESQ